nr:MAG TPA: hypothetical protein [Caudoviricetes sp.]
MIRFQAGKLIIALADLPHEVYRFIHFRGGLWIKS